VDKAIGILAANGVAAANAAQSLHSTVKGLITEAEIRSRIERARIPSARVKQIRASVPGNNIDPRLRVPRPRLDATTADIIQKHLSNAGMRDLYEFLGERHDGEPERLYQKAQDRLAESLEHGAATLEVATEQALASHAKDCFRDQAAQNKYDRTVVVASMERFRKLLDLAASADSIITDVAIQELVTQAGREGINSNDAISYVYDRAKDKNWQIERGTSNRYDTPYDAHRRDAPKRIDLSPATIRNPQTVLATLLLLLGTLIAVLLVGHLRGTDNPQQQQPPSAPSPQLPPRSSPPPHVAHANGYWQPEDGYDWVNSSSQDDLQVKRKPWIASRRFEHVVAAEREGQWRPADGYSWLVNPPRPGDMRVRPLERPDYRNKSTPPPASQASSFEQGMADRADWERWYAELTGDFQTGAYWWSG
jgi:hypothetical protein